MLLRNTFLLKIVQSGMGQSTFRKTIGREQERPSKISGEFFAQANSISHLKGKLAAPKTLVPIKMVAAKAVAMESVAAVVMAEAYSNNFLF